MSNIIKGKTAINKLNIDQASKNKSFLNSLTGGYRNGFIYYIIEGREVSASIVESIYPTKTIPKLIKGKNPNGKAV